MLDNPNDIKTRTFTVTVSNMNEKVESLIKMLTNEDDILYWRTYGRLETNLQHNGYDVDYIKKDHVVEMCILQNEFTVQAGQTVALPFMIRSYKKTGFFKERIQIKASYVDEDSDRLRKRRQVSAFNEDDSS